MVQASRGTLHGNNRLSSPSMCRESVSPANPRRLSQSEPRHDVIQRCQTNATMDLIEAVDAGDDRRCERLLRCHNVEPNIRDERGRTPLELAAVKGNRRICELLLVFGARNSYYKPWSATPLHSAAERGSVEVADLLIKRDFDVDHQSEEGDTPLHIACYHGHPPLVRFLLQFSDTNIRNRRSYTALDQAREQRHDEIVSLFTKLRVHLPLARAKPIQASRLDDRIATGLKNDVLLRVSKNDLSRCKSEPLREQLNIPPALENARSHENLTDNTQPKRRTVYAHECCPCAENLRGENGQLRNMCDDLQLKLTLALDEIEYLKRRSEH